MQSHFRRAALWPRCLEICDEGQSGTQRRWPEIAREHSHRVASAPVTIKAMLAGAWSKPSCADAVGQQYCERQDLADARVRERDPFQSDEKVGIRRRYQSGATLVTLC
jgi:hypothetical protein